jgi:hypothetical protein
MGEVEKVTACKRLPGNTLGLLQNYRYIKALNGVSAQRR